MTPSTTHRGSSGDLFLKLVKKRILNQLGSSKIVTQFCFNGIRVLLYIQGV
jgi:hypothetical protein